METTKVAASSTLGGEHLATFSRAVLNVFKSDIVEESFSQIVDGLPISSVVEDTTGEDLPDDHPLHEERQELCPSILDTTRKFCEQFDPGTLQFDVALSICSLSGFFPGENANRSI